MSITEPRIAPLDRRSANMCRKGENHEHVLLFVRFLYMIRWPHCLQRMGSRGLISLEEPQSARRDENKHHVSSENFLHIYIYIRNDTHQHRDTTSRGVEACRQRRCC